MTETWTFRTFEDPATIPDGWVWERLRLRRNMLLAESDWTQVVDSPVDVAAWADYRQALRDLPDVTTDPRAAVWPVPPN
jgi:hypothetical protein